MHFIFLFGLVLLILVFSLVNSQFESETAVDNKFVDLTYRIDEKGIVKPGRKKYAPLLDFKGIYPMFGFWVGIQSLQIAEHSHTHIDAPFHTVESGWKVDQIPLLNLIGVSGIKIDLSNKIILNEDKNEVNHNYSISIPDILAWESQFGPITPRSIVFFRTGWNKFWPDESKYLGKAFSKGTISFPGISPEAARLLADRQVVGVGIDTISIEAGQSYATHRELASRNIYTLENVANLNLLPIRGFTIWVTPVKFEESSGAPVRLYAQLY